MTKPSYPYHQIENNDKAITVRLTDTDVKALKQWSEETGYGISKIIRNSLYNDLSFHLFFSRVIDEKKI